MKFFFDNCISPHIVRAAAIIADARTSSMEMVHLKDRFQNRSIPDEKWIPAIQGEGWTIITSDMRITRSPVERAVWEESALTAFFLSNGWVNRQVWVQAAELFRWMPDIIRNTRESRPGTGFAVPFNAREMRKVFPT